MNTHSSPDTLVQLARAAKTIDAAVYVVQECISASGIVHADIRDILIRKFHVHIALYILNAWTTLYNPPIRIAPTIEDAFKVLDHLPHTSPDEIMAASNLIHAAVTAGIHRINSPNPSITKYFILAHSPFDHVATFLCMQPWSRVVVNSFMTTLYNTTNPRAVLGILFKIAHHDAIYLLVATIMRTSDPLEAPLIPQLIAKAVLTKTIPITHDVITVHAQQQLASEFAELNDPLPVDRAIYLAWATPSRHADQFGVLAVEHPISARLFVAIVYETPAATPPEIASLIPPQSHHYM